MELNIKNFIRDVLKKYDTRVDTKLSNLNISTDYTSLSNKPTLNGVEISGNKSSSDYNLIGEDHDSSTTAHSDIRSLISTNKTTIDSHTSNTDLHVSSSDRNLLTALNHNKGTFESETLLRAAYPTASSGDYCVCYNGTNYTVWTYSTDWVDTGQLGNVTSVNNLTGDITLDSNNVNYETGITLKTKIDQNQSDIQTSIGDLSALQTVDKTSIVNAINEVFLEVDNGKTLLASAITDKGVTTSKDDEFNTMLGNLYSIKSGNNNKAIVTSILSENSNNYTQIMTKEKYTVYAETIYNVDSVYTDNGNGSITIDNDYTTVSCLGYITVLDETNKPVFMKPNDSNMYYMLSYMIVIDSSGNQTTGLSGLKVLPRPCVIL
jgi:hypothetical protein